MDALLRGLEVTIGGETYRLDEDLNFMQIVRTPGCTLYNIGARGFKLQPFIDFCEENLTSSELFVIQADISFDNLKKFQKR